MSATKEMTCFICKKTKTNDVFVQNPLPGTYEKLVQRITELALLNHKLCKEFYLKCDKDITIEKLKTPSLKWYRECYKLLVHPTELKAAQQRYNKEKKLIENQLTEPLPSENMEAGPSNPIIQTYHTRGKQPKVTEESCFFCNKKSTIFDKIKCIETEERRTLLQNVAIEYKKDEWVVQLSNPKAQIYYHNNCWNNNIFNKLRSSRTSEIIENKQNRAACNIEFVSSMHDQLIKFQCTMTEACEFYNTICETYNIENRTAKYVKTLLNDFIPDALFTKPIQQNKPYVISMKGYKKETSSIENELYILMQVC